MQRPARGWTGIKDLLNRISIQHTAPSRSSPSLLVAAPFPATRPSIRCKAGLPQGRANLSVRVAGAPAEMPAIFQDTIPFTPAPAIEGQKGCKRPITPHIVIRPSFVLCPTGDRPAVSAMFPEQGNRCWGKARAKCCSVRFCDTAPVPARDHHEGEAGATVLHRPISLVTAGCMIAAGQLLSLCVDRIVAATLPTGKKYGMAPAVTGREMPSSRARFKRMPGGITTSL